MCSIKGRLSAKPRIRHIWKIRRKDFRERLLKNHWLMRGGYAEKSFGERYVISRIISENHDHYLVLFEDKEDLWQRIIAANQDKLSNKDA